MKAKHLKNLRAFGMWFLLLPAIITGVGFQEVRATGEVAPRVFTYEELTNLYENETLAAPLEEKLQQILTTPFVNNAFENKNNVQLAHSPRLGEFLRVAHWNIERGLNYEAIEAIFGSAERFAALLDTEEFPIGSDERKLAIEQAAQLRAADVIILNEVDLGMKRTGYRHIAAELAERLKMNYAFGVQFVELSPVYLSQPKTTVNTVEKEFSNFIKVDPARYLGLHGIAILSRFPLENVRLVPFKNQPYDWYRSEKNGASLIEKGRRKIADTVFLEKTLREVRRGGRSTLLADIVDSRLPEGRVTIAATHLENRTKSKNRVKQLKELLGTIKDSNHSVIVAGDMNTTGSDLTPTSLKREIVKRYGNPNYWIKQGINYMLGLGLIEDTILEGLVYWRSHSDPTVKHIPFLMPNSEQKFFSTLKDFRFTDGGAFDFRGDKTRSFGEKSRTLANSNERGGKGFVTTYQVKRPIKFVGKYKLDWIFVKPARLENPEDENASYQFAPHFGRVLTEVNRLIKDRVSDHRPLIVDLPLNEPK